MEPPDVPDENRIRPAVKCSQDEPGPAGHCAVPSYYPRYNQAIPLKSCL